MDVSISGVKRRCSSSWSIHSFELILSIDSLVVSFTVLGRYDWLRFFPGVLRGFGRPETRDSIHVIESIPGVIVVISVHDRTKNKRKDRYLHEENATVAF
jgi:hypothetical protein